MSGYSKGIFAYYTNQSSYSSVEDFIHGFAMDDSYFYLAVIEAAIDSGTGPAVMIMKIARSDGSLTRCVRLAVNNPYVQIQGLCLDSTYVYVFVDQMDAIPTTGHVMKFYKLNGSTHLDFVCSKSIGGSTYQQSGAILTGPDSNAALYHVGCTTIVGGNVALYKHNPSDLTLESSGVGRWITSGLRIAACPHQDSGNSQYLYLLGRGVRTVNGTKQHVPCIMRLSQTWSTDHTVMARQSACYLAPKSANTAWDTEYDSFIDITSGAVGLWYDDTSTLWAIGTIPRSGKNGGDGQGGDGLLMKINRNISGDMSIAAAYRITVPQATEYGFRGWGITGDSSYLYIISSFLQHSGLGDDTEVTAKHKQYICKIPKSTPTSPTWILGLTDPIKSCRNGSAVLTLGSDGYLYIGGNSNNRSRQRREACIFKIPTDPTLTDIGGVTTDSLYDSTGLYGQFNETSLFTISQIYGGSSDYCDAYNENSTAGWGSFNLYTETFTLGDSNSKYTAWSGFTGFSMLTTGDINSSAIAIYLYPSANSGTISNFKRRRSDNILSDVSTPDYYQCVSYDSNGEILSSGYHLWMCHTDSATWREFMMEIAQIASAPDGRIDKIGFYATVGCLYYADRGGRIRFKLQRPSTSDTALLPGSSDSSYLSVSNTYSSQTVRGGNVDSIEWEQNPWTSARWTWDQFSSATGSARLRAGMRIYNNYLNLAWATTGLNTMWVQVHWTPLIHNVIAGSGGMAFGGDGAVYRGVNGPVSDGMGMADLQAIVWNGGVTLTAGLSFADLSSRIAGLAALITETMHGIDTPGNNIIMGVDLVDGVRGSDGIIPGNILYQVLSQALNHLSSAAAQGALVAQTSETVRLADILARDVTIGATVIETAASSTATAGALSIARSATDGMQATDTPSRAAIISPVATESLLAGDEVSRQTDVSGNAAQSMSVSDVLQTIATFGIAAAQGLGLTSYSSSGNIWNETLTGGITLAESMATMGVLVGLASEQSTLTSSPANNVIMGTTASDGVHTADATARTLTIIREALAGTVIGDAPVRTLIVALTLAEILGLSERAAVGEPKFEEIIEGLAVQESVTQTLSRFGAALDGVSISDGATFMVEVQVAAADGMTFAETVGRITELMAIVQDACGLSDHAITFDFASAEAVIRISSPLISFSFHVKKDQTSFEKK